MLFPWTKPAPQEPLGSRSDELTESSVANLQWQYQKENLLNQQMSGLATSVKALRVNLLLAQLGDELAQDFKTYLAAELRAAANDLDGGVK